MGLVRERSIDGLILANPRISEHAHLESIRDADIPMVVLTSGPTELQGIHTVRSDSSASAQTAVNHLIQLGHQDIAFISFAQPEFDSVHEREVGWRAALSQAGLSADPALVEYADISAQSGYEATRRLLARGTRFSALFAGNDTIAFGVMRALAEARLSVPEDVAIVGYDDIPLAAFANPPLTTMHSDPIGQAKASMQLLLAQLGGSPPSDNTPYEISPRLVIRASCGAQKRISEDAGQP